MFRMFQISELSKLLICKFSTLSSFQVFKFSNFSIPSFHMFKLLHFPYSIDIWLKFNTDKFNFIGKRLDGSWISFADIWKRERKGNEMPENTVPTVGGSFYSRKRRLQNSLSLPVRWKKSLQNVPCSVQRLTEKGHKIDMISHFPTKVLIANYTDIIDLNGTREDVASAYNTLGCEIEKMQNFVKNPPKDPPYSFIITEVIKRKQDKCLTLWLKHKTEIFVLSIYFIKKLFKSTKTRCFKSIKFPWKIVIQSFC